ncbi:MAG: exosortase F system-associated protein [Gillisia sp.]
MKKLYKILGIAVLVGLLVGVRLYEERIFYDPLICFFKADYLNGNIPVFETGPLLWNVFIRYWLNSIISMGIIYIAFLNRDILKFSLLLYSLFFIGCFLAFLVLILNVEQLPFLSLFYIRRFLIHPILILVLLPAFYYYRLRRQEM